MKAKIVGSTLMVLALFLVLPVHGADKKAANEEMEAMMERMKEFGTPGAEHAVLNSLVGNWNATSKHRMKPGDKPQKSTGTSSNAWVLNGRFLKQEFKGEWNGQPFEGLGYLGYDKMKKEYVSVWMDSMGTGMFRSAGQYNASAKTITDEGTFSCPATGEKDMWFRSVWKIVNDNHLIFDMYMKDPNGKEFKSMEIDYKRVK